jgi:hypothetical protein
MTCPGASSISHYDGIVPLDDQKRFLFKPPHR